MASTNVGVPSLVGVASVLLCVGSELPLSDVGLRGRKSVKLGKSEGEPSLDSVVNENEGKSLASVVEASTSMEVSDSAHP